MNWVLTLEEILVIVLSVLINVAFITLMERKALSISQSRVGPNKVGAWGLLQPAADAVKLFTNSLTVLGPMNKVVFFASPVIALALMVCFCSLLNFVGGTGVLRHTAFVLLALFSLNVYPLLGAGWGSNSKYAVLGGLRAAAQTISYEISLAFILLCLMVFNPGASIIRAQISGGLNGLIFPGLCVASVWLITVIAELNRTPFDFAEGESELVSGFNVEYGSVKFALVFMAEYGMIYILSLITILIFILPNAQYHLLGGGLGILLMFVVIWLRATVPRFRYDLLMALTWKTLLPSALGFSQLILVGYLLS